MWGVACREGLEVPPQEGTEAPAVQADTSASLSLASLPARESERPLHS